MVTAKLLSKYDCALVAALDFFAGVRDTRNYFEKGENNFSKDYTVTIKNETFEKFQLHILLL